MDPANQFGGNTRHPATLGPCTLLLVAAVLAANLVLGIVWPGTSQLKGATLLGLCLGQIGGLAAWVFAAEAARRWSMLAATYLVAVASGAYFQWRAPGSGDLPYYLVVVLVMVIYATLCLGVILLVRWLSRALGPPSPAAAGQLPRYGVRHLLAAMVLMAVLASAFRSALPATDGLNYWRIVAHLAQGALLTTVIAMCQLERHPTVSRLGVVAATSVGLALLIGIFDRTSDHLVHSNAVHAGVMAVMMVAPGIDRHVVRIHAEPRDDVK